MREFPAPGGVLRAVVKRHEAAQGARDVELQSQAEHLRRQLQRRLLDLYLGDDLKTPELRGRLQALARERVALT